MLTRRMYSFLFTVAFGVFMICGTAGAASVQYELSSDSTFQQGCGGSCLCPVVLVGQMTGTFTLTPLLGNALLIQSGVTDFRYSVTDISWIVVDSKGQGIHKITGTGEYQLFDESNQSTTTRMHRLSLDLEIDGEKPMHFDSGEVPDEAGFPTISITVNPDTECYGIWLDIIAKPSPASTVRPITPKKRSIIKTK